MTLFDGYVAVDWSANGRPKRGPDSVWIAAGGWGGVPAPENLADRADAVVRIEALLAAATAAGRRLLLGFDFPFGYPAGTARMLTGRDGWEAVWARIAELVEDGPDNANNRFDAAAALNAAFAGDGPFWGNGLKRTFPGSRGGSPPAGAKNLPPNRRHAESEVRRAQEVWKLFGAGSVGGQALTGIAALEGLRRRTGAAVWPFETLGEGTAHVFAEIYPSLIEPAPGPEVKDARQVKAVAAALQRLDAVGALARHLVRAAEPSHRRPRGGGHDPRHARPVGAPGRGPNLPCQGRMTIFPKTSRSSMRRNPSPASSSGSTQSMTGSRRPSRIMASRVSRSATVQEFEPRIWSSKVQM